MVRVVVEADIEACGRGSCVPLSRKPARLPSLSVKRSARDPAGSSPVGIAACAVLVEAVRQTCLKWVLVVPVDPTLKPDYVVVGPVKDSLKSASAWATSPSPARTTAAVVIAATRRTRGTEARPRSDPCMTGLPDG